MGYNWKRRREPTSRCTRNEAPVRVPPRSRPRRAGLAAQQAATDSIAAAGDAACTYGSAARWSAVPSLGGVVAHRVERRPAGGGNWQPVGDVSAVADAGRCSAARFRHAVRRATGPARDNRRRGVELHRAPPDRGFAVAAAGPRNRARARPLCPRSGRAPWRALAVPGVESRRRGERILARGEERRVLSGSPALPDSVRTLRVEPGEPRRARLINNARLAPRFAGSRSGAATAPRARSPCSTRWPPFSAWPIRCRPAIATPRSSPGGLYQYYAPAPRGFFFNAGPASDTITAYSVNAVRLAAPDSIAARGADAPGIVRRPELRDSAAWRASSRIDPAARLGAAGGIRWSRSPASCGTSWTTRRDPDADVLLPHHDAGAEG